MSYQGKTILLVEDDLVTAVLQKKILTRNGFDVIVANTGEEAIQIIRKSSDQINLILMDIDLGSGIDGTEAAEVILKEYDLPLIFLSSHTEKDIVDKTEGITSYGYIVKNTGETVLIASIKMAFKLFYAQKEKDRVDQELIESEKRFHKILEHVPNISVQGYKIDGTTSYWNKASENLYGYSSEEALGKSVLDLIIPDNLKETVKKEIKTMSLTKTPIPASELVLKRKDGSLVNVFSSHSLVLKNDVVTEFFCLDLDISKEKEFEVSIKEKNKLLEGVLNGVSDILAIQKPDYTVEKFNTAGYKLLNIKSEDFDGRKKCYEFLGKRDICVDCITKKALATKKIQKNEKYFSELGLYLECISNPILDENGEVIRVIEQLKDITKQKKLEMELRDSERKYRLISENTSDGLAYLSKDFGIKYISPSYSKILGYNREEELGRGAEDILSMIHPEDREPLILKIEQAKKEKKKNLIYSYRAKHKKGHYIWREDHAKFVYDEKGEYAGAYIVARDITDRIKNANLLKEKDILASAVINNSPIGISIRSNTGQLLLCNESWREIWNISDKQLAEERMVREEFVFSDIDNAFSPYRKEIEAVYKSGGHCFIPEIFVKEINPNSKKYKRLTQHLYGITDKENKVEMVVIFTIDIPNLLGLKYENC